MGFKFGDRCSHHHQIGVDRVSSAVTRRPEIGITDVSTADDGQPPIRDPRLAMHPSVEPRQTQQHFQPAPQSMAPVSGRVEQAHLNLRMLIQRQKGRIKALHIDIIQQQPDTHAAIRRRQQIGNQQPAGHIGAPDIVDQIKTAPSQLRRKGTGGESFARIEQAKQSVLTRMRRFKWRIQRVQRGVWLGPGQRLARLAARGSGKAPPRPILDQRGQRQNRRYQ